MRFKLILLVVLFIVGKVTAQDFSFYKKELYIKNQDTLKYRILYPEDMDYTEKYPLVLFLHGSGERGTRNEKQLIHGADLFLDPNIRKNFPAVVIFPQCPNNIQWTHRKKIQSEDGTWAFKFPIVSGPNLPAQLVNDLIEEFQGKKFIDSKRIYVMGLSMGGIGALEFLYWWPEKYAAAISICGGHNPALTERYSSIPIWFFHGAKDDIVPPGYSQKVYNKLKEKNSNTKYTLYPEANHNSWDSAFAEPSLLEWLFSFKKE